MRTITKLCIPLLCLPILVSQPAWSQAQPVAQPDRVGRAVSGVLQDSMRTRGFAANDPRFANTLARISPQIAGVAGTAAAVTAGTVTAPGWASVALAVGIGAVITYAVNLGLDALTKWLFRTDGKIDESGESLPVQTSTSMTVGGAYWKVSFHSGNINIEISGGDGEAIARQGHYEYLSQTGQTSSAAPTCTVAANQVTCGIIYATKQPSGAPADCPAGSMYKNSACIGYNFQLPSSVPAKTGQTVQQAINDIPVSDYDKKLSPVVVAALANRLWQQTAAQPNYDGLPYPQTNPLTANEASAWAEQNPDYAPTIRDFVAPNPTTTAQPTPWALPSNPTSAVTSPATKPNANTTNPSSSQSQVNLGPDPGIGAPNLEAVPTAREILAPILGLMPSLRHFSPSSHSGVCPRPSLSMFNQTQVLDAHCKLIEENKSTIQAAMTFAWAAIALFVILSA